MTITEAQLRERIAVLRGSLEKLKADFHAIEGAIQDCEHWLAVLVAPVPEEKTDGGNSHDNR